MDVSDLHDIRDGTSPRRHRAFNPFVHLSPDSPLMRVLFSITRPTRPAPKLAAPARPVRKRVVRRTATIPGASMVAYAKERHDDPI